MNKLMSYLLPGIFLIAVFAIVKTFFLPPAVTVQEWFVYLTVAVTVLCVVVPCVIYYLRTPPGIDHK
jgi:cation transport ATPase